MAAVSDCFTLGSTIWCRTCQHQEIEGDVLAFDPQTKILILKSASSSGSSQLHDVHFVNLALVSQLQVKKEVSTPVTEPPQSLNLQRLNTRIRTQVEEKRRMLTSMPANVTPAGQSLFKAIAKTIKEVRWKNADIVVWDNKVVITPPYSLDNVMGAKTSREFEYIQKVVDKHMKDTALCQTSVNPQQVAQHNSNMQ